MSVHEIVAGRACSRSPSACSGARRCARAARAGASRAHRRVRARAARAAERAGRCARPPARRDHRPRRRARRGRACSSASPRRPPTLVSADCGARARAHRQPLHRRHERRRSARPGAPRRSTPSTRPIWPPSSPAAYGGPVEVTPLAVPSLQSGALAVLRPQPTQPFSAVERAQLRVLADSAVRTAHNARLFTLAETLRVEAEERERERARLSDRLLRVEEDERRRLALALHDGPQQSIAGIGLIVQAAHDAISAPASRARACGSLQLRPRALPQRRALPAHADVRARADHPARPRLHGRVLRARRAALGVAQGRDRRRRERDRRSSTARRRSRSTASPRRPPRTPSSTRAASRVDVTRALLEKGGIELVHRRRRARGERGRTAARRHAPRRRRHARARLRRGRHLTFEATPGGGCTVRVIVPPRPAGDGADAGRPALRAA